MVYANEGARRLRAALDASGETQQAAERRLGAAVGVVSRLLSGERLPGRVLAASLLEAYAIPLGAWDQPAAQEIGRAHV